MSEMSGAASGMGAAEAHLFAKEGVTVIVADQLEGQSRPIVAEIALANWI